MALPQPVLCPNASEAHQALWEGLAAEARQWLLKLLSVCYAIRSCRLKFSIGKFEIISGCGTRQVAFLEVISASSVEGTLCPYHKCKGNQSHQSGRSLGKPSYRTTFATLAIESSFSVAKVHFARLQRLTPPKGQLVLLTLTVYAPSRF